MKYEVRNGIVRMKICGVSFLTPIRKEMKYCSPIMPLTLFCAIIWSMLSEGDSIEEVYNVFHQMLGSRNNMSIEKIDEIVNKNLNELVDNGYVIRVEE